jgi:hypothetical protein
MPGPAVLFVVHRRRGVLQQAFEAVRRGRPGAVYVSGDAPRPGVESDIPAIDRTWEMIESFEWECPVFLRRSQAHGGLIHGVHAGISWFLENAGEGVILEDDVKVDPKSLEFMSVLLDRYRDDHTVGTVTLFNSVPRRRITHPDDGYRFSRLASSQYWATWRDRWVQYVPDLTHWRSQLGVDGLSRLGNEAFVKYWSMRFDNTGDAGGSWETRWLYSHWLHEWSVVNSNRNYSLHMGFTHEATNSFRRPSWYPTEMDEWDGSTAAPQQSTVDRRADDWLANQRFGLSRAKAAKRWIKGFGKRVLGRSE